MMELSIVINLSRMVDFINFANVRAQAELSASTTSD